MPGRIDKLAFIKGPRAMAIGANHLSRAIRLGLVVVVTAALAISVSRAGDLEAAKQSYTAGNGLFDEGRFAEAAASYDRAITEDPKLTEAYYNRALATEMIDRAQALDAWQRFIDAAGDSNQFRWDVARIKARMQVLKDKPPLPSGLAPSRYVAGAGDGDYYRWVSLTSEDQLWAHFPVKVYLGSAPQVKWQQGAREAFDIWSATLPMQLLATPEQADIRIDWSSGVSEDGHLGEELDWIRYARVGDQISGRLVATIRLELTRNYTKDEMRASVLHEMGHALGIKGHSDNKKDIMYYQSQEKTRQLAAPNGAPLPLFWRSLVSQPSQRDVNTLIRLYNSAGTIARFN